MHQFQQSQKVFLQNEAIRNYKSSFASKYDIDRTSVDKNEQLNVRRQSSSRQLNYGTQRGHDNSSSRKQSYRQNVLKEKKNEMFDYNGEPLGSNYDSYKPSLTLQKQNSQSHFYHQPSSQLSCHDDRNTSSYSKLPSTYP